MKFFPNGAGLIAFGLALVFAVVAVISFKKNKKVMKIISSVVSVVSLCYLVIGCIVFFRPPFFSQGEAYFKSKVKSDVILSYAANSATGAEFVDKIAPQTEMRTDAQEKTEHRVIYTDTSRVEIVIFTFENAEEAKKMYEAEIGSEASETAVYISPISYDGTKFLLPFVDTNGTHFKMSVYSDNWYVNIREASETYDMMFCEQLSELK